jgi:hypothetical protein
MSPLPGGFILRGVYPDDSFPPSGHNTLHSQVRALNNEIAAADHAYQHNPVPAAVFSEETTLLDSILSSHRYYDHPSDFEPDLPKLLSHAHNSDEESIDDSAPTDHRNVWLNTDRLVPYTYCSDQRPLWLSVTNTTPTARAVQGIRTFELFFTSDLPLEYELGVPLDTTIQVKTLLRHTLDGHLGTPQFLVMGRQHTDGRAFGMRWNLATCIHTHFPPVILNTPGAHSALHPFLYGYEGSCQAQTKKHGDFYAVAHGWGGPSIFRSYAMAWTAQADFKLQAHLNLPGGICQFRTARRRKTSTRHEADIVLSLVTPQVPSLRPPAIATYLLR